MCQYFVLLWIILFLNLVFSVRCLQPRIDNLFTRRVSMSEIFAEDKIVQSLAEGTQLALIYCQNVFEWNRWNCPASAFSRINHLPMNRETAFIRAIIAAGVMYTIAKNCSNGDLNNKICLNCNSKSQFTEYEQIYNQNHLSTDIDQYELDTDNKLYLTHESISKWPECYEKQIQFSEEMSVKYLDNLETNEIDLQSYILLHNNAAGRMAIKTTMKTSCRCHGISGSCSVQTCWKELAPFEEVANLLRQKYDEAVHVTFENGSDRIVIGNSARAGIIGNVPLTDFRNLIYLEESPNYCLADTNSHWNGTVGRVCSNNEDPTKKIKRRNCKQLCKSCGYRVKKRTRQRKWRCQCNFKWCCEVTCKICSKKVQEYFCD